MTKRVGIVGYGTYIPRYRLKVSEIINVWHNTTDRNLKRAMISEKAIPGLDEDTLTMAIEASKEAIDVAKIGPLNVGAVFLGSSTHPYVSKASSVVLLETLGIANNAFCADIQFSGKSGSTAIQICMGLVKAGMIRYGLVSASDSLGFQIRPGEPYEYYGSAGAASYVIGNDGVIAEIEATVSYNTDSNDYYRLDGDRYIRYGGPALEFGGMGYEKHITTATKDLMKKLNCDPEDFDFAVFHQPYGKRPFIVGNSLGFKKEQILTGNLAENLGDCGAASSLLGLAAVLDVAKPGNRILLVSYGFGAGSDALSLIVTDEILLKVGKGVKSQLENKKIVNYSLSTLFERKYTR
ncbi:MAG: hydroxymethylglutaryl-CoA synthase [Candidatus Heimdallarchaeota archaeon]